MEPVFRKEPPLNPLGSSVTAPPVVCIDEYIPPIKSAKFRHQPQEESGCCVQAWVSAFIILFTTAGVFYSLGLLPTNLEELNDFMYTHAEIPSARTQQNSASHHSKSKPKHSPQFVDPLDDLLKAFQIMNIELDTTAMPSCFGPDTGRLRRTTEDGDAFIVYGSSAEIDNIEIMTHMFKPTEGAVMLDMPPPFKFFTTDDFSSNNWDHVPVEYFSLEMSPQGWERGKFRGQAMDGARFFKIELPELTIDLDHNQIPQLGEVSMTFDVFDSPPFLLGNGIPEQIQLPQMPEITFEDLSDINDMMMLSSLLMDPSFDLEPLQHGPRTLQNELRPSRGARGHPFVHSPVTVGSIISPASGKFQRQQFFEPERMRPQHVIPETLRGQRFAHTIERPKDMRRRTRHH